MKIYDTLTARKRDFVPLGSPVKVYVCGLTPKNNPHLGHAKSFVTTDMMRRYLEHLGYEVLYVQNFTDVEDKIIARAHLEGLTPEQVAQKYTAAFFRAMDTLNCRRADRYPLVTASMPGIITMVQGLIERGHAYEVEGNVYFRVSTFPTYGRLSKRTQEDNQVGAGLSARQKVVDTTGAALPALSEEPAAPGDQDAVDTGEPSVGKLEARDFALWKRAKPGEPSWESPWGPGRPGWHIECSTMVLQELGEQIDIHGGGQDLIFPHHENEIAQSESYTGRHPFANYWVHIGALMTMAPRDSAGLDGFRSVDAGGADAAQRSEKMSHSLGNFTAVEYLVQRYESDAVRLYLLSQHYRSPVNYSEDALATAAEGWERLRSAYINLDLLLNWEPVRAVAPDDPVDVELTKAGRRLRQGLAAAQEAFRAGMDDDFNAPQAIAALHDLARDINNFKNSLREPSTVNPSVVALLRQAREAFTTMAEVLGFRAPQQVPGLANLAEAGEADLAFIAQVEAMLEERKVLKDARDYVASDAIRGRLEALGVEVQDHPQGTVWFRRSIARGAAS